MSLSSFFSSLLPVVHNDAPKEEEEVKEQAQPEEEPEEKEEEPAAEEEEEEEEEPEDPMPAIREECAQSSKCAAATKHFQHCQERVSSGKVAYHNEDCVEELYHMMHCVDTCVAPRLFAKLK
ncbi:Non-heme 11 kDa protein of cytochrome bc1 complex [Obba rivulosa]|uniref:Non-heme 11 kDa protein of cytochrome bc1 complex n=1 Tax=Obba rivulosa TaxID=1052685 RepID=A0A8E2DIT7_9APHY|nr:Non-heme 11 kDa protein of cytochrome bc1 complex [Obba rivulosa]